MIIKPEVKQQIWAALDKMRATGRFSIGDSKLLEIIAATRGLEKLDTILQDESLTHFFANKYDGFVPPMYVYDFINEIAKTIDIKTHFDP